MMRCYGISKEQMESIMRSIDPQNTEQHNKSPIYFDGSVKRNVTLCGEIISHMYIEFNGRKGDNSFPKRVSFKLHAPAYFRTDRGSFKREEFHTVEVLGPLCFEFLDEEKFKQGKTVWLTGTHVFENLVLTENGKSFAYSNLVLENENDSVQFLEVY
jgi:hypothetical protein